MKALGRQTFNDTLGLLLVAGIPCLWVAHHWWPIPAEALGATISAWTAVVLFYFRKAPPPNGNGIAPKP